MILTVITMKVLFRYVDRMSKIKLRCSQISLLPWRSLLFLWWFNHPVHSKDPDQRTASSNFFYHRWIAECLVGYQRTPSDWGYFYRMARNVLCAMNLKEQHDTGDFPFISFKISIIKILSAACEACMRSHFWFCVVAKYLIIAGFYKAPTVGTYLLSWNQTSPHISMWWDKRFLVLSRRGPTTTPILQAGATLLYQKDGAFYWETEVSIYCLLDL